MEETLDAGDEKDHRPHISSASVTIYSRQTHSVMYEERLILVSCLDDWQGCRGMSREKWQMTNRAQCLPIFELARYKK
jgi:hypothetical protein